MLRPLIAGGLIALIATPQNPSDAGPPQNCREFATASRTRTIEPPLAITTTTTCAYDKATNQATCTSLSKERLGTMTTTVSVTTFESVADLIDEVKAVPPLRRSTRTDMTVKTARKSTTSSLVNTYDSQGRLVREVGTSPSDQFTTTYTSWDAAGRPTAGTSVHRGWDDRLAFTYNDAKHTQTTITSDQGQRTTCRATFDANGNPASTSCTGPEGSRGSTMTTTATERICR